MRVDERPEVILHFRAIDVPSLEVLALKKGRRVHLRQAEAVRFFFALRY
jgi:hypothetical protein